jgi:hypothetical protein
MGNNLPRLACNVTVLRLICVVVSFLLIPAFQYGFVSIWVLVFAIILGFKFRAGLIKLNEKLYAADDIKTIRYRISFFLICLECMIYTAISLQLFFQLYVRGFVVWPDLNGVQFDDAIKFFETTSLISFFDITEPKTNPSLYLISVSNILAYFVLSSLICVAGIQCLIFRRVTVKKYFKGKGARESLLNLEVPDYYMAKIRGVWAVTFILIAHDFLFMLTQGAYNRLDLAEGIASTLILPYFLTYLTVGLIVRFQESLGDMSLGKRLPVSYKHNLRRK